MKPQALSLEHHRNMEDKVSETGAVTSLIFSRNHKDEDNNLKRGEDIESPN